MFRNNVSTLVALLISFASLGNAAEETPPKPRLGMNLQGPADWNTELPLVDVFRLSRTWISQRNGAAWGNGPPLAIDPHGWVMRLEPDSAAETLLCTIDGGHYPSGAYTVLYEGKGRIEFSRVERVVSSEPGRIVVEVDASRGGFFLKLTETDPDDYVRNIRLIMPGFEDTYSKNPFHPVFLERWQGVACFRFMDWMKTNGSKIRTWGDRPAPEDATFSKKGIPLELMLDLCNRQKADAWFCIPHLADDDFVRQFAAMVKEKLDPGLKVYIEYSNEVWNSQFAQTRESWERGTSLGLGSKERPWEGGGMYYAKRSVEIFKIFEDTFGSNDRLVRVLAWQSGNTWWMDRIVLPYEEAYRHADALAIAPYVSMNVRAQGKGLTAEQVAGWSVEQTLDYLEIESLPRAVRSIQASREMADKYNLTLIAYEGGQHMVGVAGGENNESMTRLFQAANTHPRMGQIYKQYFNAWTQAGGDLFCYFSSVGRSSKWGSWGILEYYDDDPAQSPKFMATLEWAKQCHQPVRIPR